ncbi:hypothetical protein GUJ93_ZPchr0011g27527 [Zizania palustris]|uniref:Protein FAM136A n=1 Tax=Zizania palustris TaxID=103762 RepID=A0A8J5WEC2_ZIZPA|nr:hypothetical protein GUJ93_ZPchr0011g27527 [Zizania palustris]
MDHVGSVEETVVTERIRRKLEEVNAAAQKHLAGVQDHVNFTMQQAYFRCAYECFDRRRSQEMINNCVENCSVPVLTANNVVETEMAKFQVLPVSCTYDLSLLVIDIISYYLLSQ